MYYLLYVIGEISSMIFLPLQLAIHLLTCKTHYLKTARSADSAFLSILLLDG